MVARGKAFAGEFFTKDRRDSVGQGLWQGKPDNATRVQAPFSPHSTAVALDQLAR